MKCMVCKDKPEAVYPRYRRYDNKRRIQRQVCAKCLKEEGIDPKTQTRVWTAEEIKEAMRLNPEWAVRGLMAIFNFQTYQEKDASQTVEDNGVGFTGFDAELLSSYAKQYKKRGTLTLRQRLILAKRMKKYGNQLAGIANGKIR